MRILQPLLLPASEIVDFIYDTIHYPFFYAFLFFLLSQPWRPEYKPPLPKDDGLPKTTTTLTRRGDFKELLDRLVVGDHPTTATTSSLQQNGNSTTMISHDNPYIEPEPTKTALMAAEAVKGLICRLTNELPFDPVTAEDGHVYERAALEDYFRQQQQQKQNKKDKDKDNNAIPSPVTNELMGQRFLSSPQYKRIIETLIKNGVITGTLAEKWEERALHKEHMDDMLNMAQQGVVIEQLAVACNYLVGEGDFKADAQVAYQWFTKAHNAGSPIGTAGVGLMLSRGVGTTKDAKKGLEYLLLAAKGSDFAAYMLGLAYADGKLGLKIDTTEAGNWLKRCLGNGCAQQHMTMEDKFMAQQKLDEVMQRCK